MSVKIDLFSDGILVGFTYYPAGEIDDDFNELNIYLFIIRISYKWI
jgi:hypothetical protein